MTEFYFGVIIGSTLGFTLGLLAAAILTIAKDDSRR